MKEILNFLNNTPLEKLDFWCNNENDTSKKEAFKALRACVLETTPDINFGEELRVISDKDLNLVFNDYGYIDYTNILYKTIETISFNHSLMTRSYAEYDENYRQIVCNALINVTINGVRNFGFLIRNNNYNEPSLSGSIAMVGGHVNAIDSSFYMGLMREVSEELPGIRFENNCNIKPLGFIREKSNGVSGKHLCILYLIELKLDHLPELSCPEEKESFVWYTEDQIKSIIKKGENQGLDSWALAAIQKYLHI